MAVVVLPTPPFWLATARTFANCTSTVELFHVEHSFTWNNTRRRAVDQAPALAMKNLRSIPKLSNEMVFQLATPDHPISGAGWLGGGPEATNIPRGFSSRIDASSSSSSRRTDRVRTTSNTPHILAA